MAQTVPSVVFKTRVRNEALGGPNPFEWKDLTTDEIFKGKRVVLFALPGAFTMFQWGKQLDTPINLANLAVL